MPGERSQAVLSGGSGPASGKGLHAGRLHRRSVPLQRGLPPKRNVPVRKKRLQPGRGPDRSSDYLAWIRTLSCILCSQARAASTVVEAAHMNASGRRRMAQKTTDFSAIPLCPGHHRINSNSYHRLGEECF